MRTPHNDRELTPTSQLPEGGEARVPGQEIRAPKPVRKPAADGDGPERRCILSGEHGSREALIRLALSPDGVLVPDIMARAPGRGAWIGVDRAALEAAIAKGKIKGALARAFKGAPVNLPADLGAQIDAAFHRTLMSQLGLAAKAGVLLTGAEKVDVAARSGQVALLCHASDAADDGRRKRDQSWRVGEDAEGSGMTGRVLPVDRTALSVALGRDNAVHIAIIDAGWGERLSALLDRWHQFAGSSMDPQGSDATTTGNASPTETVDGGHAAV
ncbi:DUF448 domain-containing protein [Sphingomonas lacunae]|uniref:DUF448 domain-containing protein n=1 Tax=Sphingomonas lacunae TaxID=2698828 RepID=A0A6M4ATL5_9SPHN|nr:DUF448 domain-containing protein [Sphingomonas lacunae]QJQ31770.1 DUF448 domain-containing protein [Sphingomonas lacunae]